MSATSPRPVKGYCGFCAVHCPVVTTVDGGRVLAVEPDRAHPLGGAICGKGRAAPEFHTHRERVDFPHAIARQGCVDNAPGASLLSPREARPR